MVPEGKGQSQGNQRGETFVFQIGFALRFRYTAVISFCGMGVTTLPFP